MGMKEIANVGRKVTGDQAEVMEPASRAACVCCCPHKQESSRRSNTASNVASLTASPAAAASRTTSAETARVNNASCLLVSMTLNRLASSSSNANAMPYTVL